MADVTSAKSPFGEKSEPVSVYDRDFRLTGYSADFSRLHEAATLADATLWQIHPELSNEPYRSKLNSVISGGIVATVELALPESDAKRHLLIFRTDGGVGIREIGLTVPKPQGALENDRDLLLHQATHDLLTGLPNRRAFSSALPSLLPTEAEFALMQIDLDDFKLVNDTLGHGAGDIVLRMAAERIRNSLGPNDTAYRLAGDEFAVIQRSVDQPAEAERLAETVVGAFKEPLTIDGITVFVGASVGVAVAPTDGNNSEELMKAADIALYAAKNDGRRRARTFQRSMLLIIEHREMLRRSLRTALQKEEFYIEYQPIVGSRSMIVGFEALVRWRHPMVGMVPPSVFIPMAEADGLMSELGQWVLSEATRQASKWPKHLKLAVNVSSAEFLREGLSDRIADALDTAGFDAERLELEITESVLLERTTENLDILNTLNVLGVQVSLDDFGTRYSSLDHLMNFPFDTIKIDRGFIRDIETDEKCQTIVRFVILLAHGLGMLITAEGVESAGQALWLEKAGCDQMQGYLFGAPMPAKAISDFLGQPSGSRLNITNHANWAAN
ncbi:diguanylate cyclase (plasmid) [Rhizobium leguminosarum bv. trifolii CB782]|nr:diguanylate cyclase [Rhizobium leguminosarum bv. trifolii CB782]